MVIAHLKKGEHDLARLDRLASCGRPVPWMHVALLDPHNRPVGPGATGEICTRGPLVMTGYKDLPDETAEALSGDWLHTGDVGRFDDDGYLYIVDRTKDMVDLALLLVEIAAAAKLDHNFESTCAADAVDRRVAEDADLRLGHLLIQSFAKQTGDVISSGLFAVAMMEVFEHDVHRTKV